ncbi:MAG: p22 coat protein [Pedosphaera sp.]|nr:p22 coat protein [Pedosphaera sp.]
MKLFKAVLILLALMLSVVIGLTSHDIILPALLLVLVGGCMTLPKPRCCVGPTLSVPEILMDVMDAFKLETPSLSLFSTDFSSKTAVLGDKITAHIDHVPVGANYDPTPGRGFYNGAQDVTTIIEDVPVLLNQFKHVPIKVGWLTQLSSKLPLYKRAVANIGYALGKIVTDAALAQVVGNFSNGSVISIPNTNLDTVEFIRSALNTQKAASKGRFGVVSTPFATALQNDDRVKSNLFYGALNGDQGYRIFKSMGGFGTILEYPDFSLTGANNSGIFGDPRAIVIASRRPDFSNVASELGIPQVMEFYPMEDTETGLFITGVAWQEVGTGDVYVSAAVLFGIGAGNQGGAAGTITDNAGYLLRSA